MELVASEGDLFHVTEDTITTYAGLNKRDDDGFFWIKYALPEAESVDMIDLAARRGSEANRMPTWFKIEGSNDDENWDLLLERAFLTQWYDGESRQYWINNETPYKFFRVEAKNQKTKYITISEIGLYEINENRDIRIQIKKGAMDKKRYKLPHKYHDAEEDIVQLMSTLKEVDSDVTKIEEDTKNTEENVTNIKNRLLRVSIPAPVIRGIAPNTYVVLNETGE